MITLAALPPLGATGVLLAYAWALLGLDRLARRLACAPQTLAAIALVAVKWSVIDTLAVRLSPGWSAMRYTPMFNPVLLTGVATAGSIIAMYRLRRASIEALQKKLALDGAPAAVFVLTIVSAMMTLGLSFEVDRVVERMVATAWPAVQIKLIVLTVLWMAAFVVCLLIGKTLDTAGTIRRTWERVAWTGVALLAVKFVAVDTFSFAFGGTPTNVTPLMNLQTLAALAVSGGIFAIYFLLGNKEQDEHFNVGLRVIFAAVVVIVWTGTLEINRLVGTGAFPGLAVWPRWQLTHFAWTAWWTLGATGYLAFTQWRDATAIRRLPWLQVLTHLPVLLAGKFLIFDTLGPRLLGGAANATTLANLQTFAGAVVFGAVFLVREFTKDVPDRTPHRATGAIAVVMLLWLGGLEIDRAFQQSSIVQSRFADPALAEQVALSIFFSGFAIGSVALGFQVRLTKLRYFGLALFALTLLKVGVIDLRETTVGYRILSCMGLGILLLVTSVLYGKLSPVLLREQGALANDLTV